MGYATSINPSQYIHQHNRSSNLSFNVKSWFLDEKITIDFGDYTGRPSSAILLKQEYITRFLENGWSIDSVLSRKEDGIWEDTTSKNSTTSSSRDSTGANTSSTNNSSASSSESNSASKTTNTSDSNTNGSNTSTSSSTSESNSDSSSSSSSNSDTDHSYDSSDSGSSSYDSGGTSSSHNQNNGYNTSSSSNSSTSNKSHSTTSTDGTTRSTNESSTHSESVNESNTSSKSTTNQNGSTDTASNSNDNENSTSSTQDSTTESASYWVAVQTVRMKRRRLQPELVLNSMVSEFSKSYNQGVSNADNRYNEIVTLYSAVVSANEKDGAAMITNALDVTGLFNSILSKINSAVSNAVKSVSSMSSTLTADAENEIRRQFDALLAKSKAEMISNGTYNGTVWVSVAAGIERQRSDALVKAKAEASKSESDSQISLLNARGDIYVKLVDAKNDIAAAIDKRRVTAVELRNSVLKWMLDFIGSREDVYPQLQEISQIAERMGFSVGASGNVL